MTREEKAIKFFEVTKQPMVAVFENDVFTVDGDVVSDEVVDGLANAYDTFMSL